MIPSCSRVPPCVASHRRLRWQVRTLGRRAQNFRSIAVAVTARRLSTPLASSTSVCLGVVAAAAAGAGGAGVEICGAHHLLGFGSGGAACFLERGNGGVGRAEPAWGVRERAEGGRVVDGRADTAAERALEAGGTAEGDNLEFAAEAAELAPLGAVLGRGPNVEAPCNGVGILDNELHAEYDDRVDEGARLQRQAGQGLLPQQAEQSRPCSAV
ncbi:hypothetical protein FB451DRAFT_1486125 [Mycena latifolia]|nr:hypothetical protein FB451DRAFT_1486125 [Mycena latifolia]